MKKEVGTVQPWTLLSGWAPTSTSSFSLFISAGQKYESPEEEGKGERTEI